MDRIHTHWPDVRFTPIEVTLLRYLLDAQGEVVTREQLLADVWGYTAAAKTNTVRTTIQRLRAKIEPDPRRPKWIVSLRGRGYRLVVPPPRFISLVPEATRSNLVAEGTRLMGRDADLAALEALLENGARWLTIHGGPGLGKSRLARHLAHGRAHRYPGGAWFCDLSACRTTTAARQTLAEVLDVAWDADRQEQVFTQMCAALSHRGPTMWVIDNIEQLRGTAGAWLERLHMEATELVMLVTSRDRRDAQNSSAHPLSALLPEHGEALLMDRLGTLGGVSAAQQDVGDLAKLLDGVPLAIEMAASRARLIPLRQLCARIQADLAVLRLDRHDAPPRHQSMKQAIAWSWELLTPQERQRMAHLCGSGAEPPREDVGGLANGLETLVDQSLVQVCLHDGRAQLVPAFGVPAFIRSLQGGVRPPGP